MDFQWELDAPSLQYLVRGVYEAEDLAYSAIRHRLIHDLLCLGGRNAEVAVGKHLIEGEIVEHQRLRYFAGDARKPLIDHPRFPEPV